MKYLPWNTDDLIKVLALYHQIPFGRMHARTPEVINLSKAIGRTSNSIALKLVNFASLDAKHHARGVKGMSNHSKRDKEIWKKYHNNWDVLAFAHSDLDKQPVEDIDTVDSTSRTTLVKIRIGQQFFRRSVLANFEDKCAFTGIYCSDLLRASHIIPWSKNVSLRLNPKNGICLNAILDAAFDKGWIGIDESFRAVISIHLTKFIPDDVFNTYFRPINLKKLSPCRFYPEIEYLKFHFEHIFRGKPL
jgi:putative restriction endonuclease